MDGLRKKEALVRLGRVNGQNLLLALERLAKNEPRKPVMATCL